MIRQNSAKLHPLRTIWFQNCPPDDQTRYNYMWCPNPQSEIQLGWYVNWKIIKSEVFKQNITWDFLIINEKKFSVLCWSKIIGCLLYSWWIYIKSKTIFLIFAAPILPHQCLHTSKYRISYWTKRLPIAC